MSTLKIGIKVKKLKFWVWFDKTNTKEDDTKFEGTNGWGGETSNITIAKLNVHPRDIEGRIEADGYLC